MLVSLTVAHPVGSVIVTGILRCARARQLRRGNARRTTYLDYTNPLPDLERWWIEADKRYCLTSGKLPRWMDPSLEDTEITVRVRVLREADGIVWVSRINAVD